MGCGCMKCRKCSGWMLLAIGVVLVLQDLGTWDIGLSWYTLGFLYMGFTKVAMVSCKGCQAMCSTDKKKK